MAEEKAFEECQTTLFSKSVAVRHCRHDCAKTLIRKHTTRFKHSRYTAIENDVSRQLNETTFNFMNKIHRYMKIKHYPFSLKTFAL